MVSTALGAVPLTHQAFLLPLASLRAEITQSKRSTLSALVKASTSMVQRSTSCLKTHNGAWISGVEYSHKLPEVTSGWLFKWSNVDQNGNCKTILKKEVADVEQGNLPTTPHNDFSRVLALLSSEDFKKNCMYMLFL